MERAGKSGHWQSVRSVGGTLLRLAGCVLLFGAFLAGSYGVPVTLVSVLGFAVMLSLLACYELAIRDREPIYILAASFTLILFSLGGYDIWLLRQPPAPTGPLVPAGEPTPATACREAALGPNDLAMVFGTDRVVGRGAGPYRAFKVDSCPGIGLKRQGPGLLVSATGYGWTDDIAFMVRDNRYRELDPVQLRVVRPDRSTFVLLDRYNEEVVYVRYLNRNAVRLRGRFLCGEAPQAVIRDTGIWTGGVRISGVDFHQHRAPSHACAESTGGVGIQIGDPRRS